MLILEIFTQLQISNNIAQEAGKKFLTTKFITQKRLAIASLFEYSHFKLIGHIVKSATFHFYT